MPELQPEAIALAESNAGLVTAPAGCGKTQLVTEAVQHSVALEQYRQLVLTHTHAGVDALRARLVEAGVQRDAYQVETIDGWAQRFALSFPGHCPIDVPHGHDEYWGKTHRAVAALLEIPAIKQVIASSYGGVFVDEYQDCTNAQHDLVIKLGSMIPIRVLGDPLQGIFDFAGAIDWNQQVSGTFTEVGPLTTPWRWTDKNERLGQWLIDQRATFTTGSCIDLGPTPVIVRTPTNDIDLLQTTWNACSRLRCEEGTVVIVGKWARTYAAVAKTLQGSFSVIEPIESIDLTRHARALATSTGAALAVATINLAKACATGVGDTIGTAAINKFTSGEIPNPTRYRTNKEFVELLVDVANDGSAVAVHRALTAIKRASSTKVYRRELIDEIMRALTATDGAITEDDFPVAVAAVRSRTRHAGRRLPQRALGSPQLIKGLQFDHVLVLKPEELSRRELYVALSRATRSATVVSTSATLTLND